MRIPWFMPLIILGYVGLVFTLVATGSAPEWANGLLFASLFGMMIGVMAYLVIQSRKQEENMLHAMHMQGFAVEKQARGYRISGHHEGVHWTLRTFNYMDGNQTTQYLTIWETDDVCSPQLQALICPALIRQMLGKFGVQYGLEHIAKELKQDPKQAGIDFRGFVEQSQEYPFNSAPIRKRYALFSGNAGLAATLTQQRLEEALKQWPWDEQTFFLIGEPNLRVVVTTYLSEEADIKALLSLGYTLARQALDAPAATFDAE
jgi:hypothetical protein